MFSSYFLDGQTIDLFAFGQMNGNYDVVVEALLTCEDITVGMFERDCQQ